MRPVSDDPPSTPARSVFDTPRALLWGIFFLVWTIQVGLYAFSTHHRRRGTTEAMGVGEALLVAAIDWYVWAAICLFCFSIARWLPLERHRLRFLVPVLLSGSLAITVVRGVLDQGIAAMLGWEPISLVERMIPVLPGRFILVLLFIGVGYAIDYIRMHRQRELNAAHLRAELAATQLQMLKVQLQPHFLFNTLHAISSLMYIDVAAADRMLVRLSELLRRTLQTMDAQQVTLAEEISFLEPYLEIEKIRFGKRLSVRIDVGAGTRTALVPHLILQPLVENAVRHGIAPAVSGGTIRVSSTANGNELRLIVSDDGIGLTPPSKNGGAGVGLTNARDRLSHLYGDRASVALEGQPEGGVRVTVTLPLDLAPASEKDRELPQLEQVVY